MRFDWEQLTDSVHRCRLPFLDVTVGLVQGRTGALLVDTGTTLTEAGAIRADVLQIAGRSVTHVVLTHKHFDHILGSGAFHEAQIYCAPQVFTYITTAIHQLRDDALRYGADAGEVDRAITALRPPEHATDDAVVDLGDRRLSIAYLGRGHTTSDLVVVVPGYDSEPAVVFTGDLIEESGAPAIDADSDVASWPDTLDRLLGVGGPDAIYVPGHGRVVDAEFARRQRDWLRSCHPER
ncbi:MAG: MBL fold metallo-hydrolase [Mycobacterium sp.]